MNLIKIALKTLIIPVFGFCISQSALATVVTFDDIATDDQGVINNGYAGLNWGEFHYIKGVTSPGSGYDNGVVSGEYVAFNWFAAVTTIGGSLFDFNSTYLTAAWNTGLNITVEGWLNGSMTHTQTVVVDNTGPTLFNFDFVGIDSLRFNSFGGVDANGNDGGAGEHFVMDDFTFNAAQVGEPSVMALFGLGLFGAGMLRRRNLKS